MNFPNINRKTISFFLAVLLSIFCLGGTFSCLPAYAALESWSDTSTKQAIVNFVNKVIADGIPEKDRIAVFDNDGTLWAEKPHYFQEDFIKDRLKKSPNVRVSNLLKMTQKEIEKTTGDPISAEGKIILKEIPGTIGLTNGQYKTKAHDFLVNTNHKQLANEENDKGYVRFDTPYINLTYQPVIELVNYLKENGFKVYICSGGGLYFVRSFSDEAYGIPSEEVIGSAIKITYNESNKIDGSGGSLVRQLGLAHYDDQQGKPVGIELFIGKKPLIAVGNSSGDFEMFKYTDSGVDNSLIVLINHDDCVREYKYNDVVGSTHLEDDVPVPDNESLDYAKDHDNWIVVSMKDDFTTIFKSNPSRTPPVCSN